MMFLLDSEFPSNPDTHFLFVFVVVAVIAPYSVLGHFALVQDMVGRS